MELINKSDVINITAKVGALETQSRVRKMPAIINIPDNATNGDVIKALFPDIKVYGCSGYAHSSDKSSVLLEHMSNDWWNAPYKVGDTE